MSGTNLFARVTSTLSISLTDETGKAMYGKCVGVPPTTANLFQHGCLLVRTDSGTGNPALYENVGTAASPSWNLVGTVSAGEISLAEGSFLVGNSSGVATALDAKTSGRVLVGNGTTVTSVALSSDATLASSGALTIANSAVTPAKMSTAAKTHVAIIPFKVLAPSGSNQALGNKALFICSQAITIVSVKIASDVATSGSDATNNYEFMPLNVTTPANLHLSSTKTNTGELSSTAFTNLTVSQNLSFTASQVFGVTVTINDDGGSGPTNLSAANLYAVLEYTLS